eukprot:5447619-Ditylum_brightwellii.AAC.1
MKESSCDMRVMLKEKSISPHVQVELKSFPYLVSVLKAIATQHARSHEHYHKEVYHLTMNKVCSDFHGYDEEDLNEMPDELTSVGWNNGGIQHLTTVVREEIYDECIPDKNIRCK